METLDMEIALLKHLNVRINIIVTNVWWGMTANLHECDILSLSKSGYATEVEIKTSKADLLKDKFKKHRHNHELLKYLYFAVPEELEEIALKEIPERAGLYVVRRYEEKIYAKKVKTALKNKDCLKWTEEQRLKLAHLGAMRILTLKKNIKKQGGK